MKYLATVLLILTFCVATFGQEQSAAAPFEAGNVVPNPQVVPYSNAKDLFGKGMADRYNVWQVTIGNTDESRQFQITNLIGSYDPRQCRAVEALYPAFKLSECEASYNLHFKYPMAYAPVQQSELLGVAQVRQVNSSRAVFFRALDFGVTMAGALAPFNFIGRDGRSGIGILAGTGVGAIQRLFPDLSPSQLQRLMAMSYDGKTIIGPQQASTFLIFIPRELVFSDADWKEFKTGGETLKLSQLFATAQVTGNFITATPQITVRSGIR
jgi:hypothetical protein